MIRIAITTPEITRDEPVVIRTILDSGWDFVHLRHPGETLDAVRQIIESIPQSYHNRLRLHGHFALVNEFNLGGLQLNSRCPVAPSNFCGSLSRSCHSVDEVNSSLGFSYVTLSPVFPSISKPGYHTESQFCLNDLHPEAPPVIALGGVTPHNISRIADMRFAGYAVLGALMQGATAFNISQRLAEFNNPTYLKR